MRKGVLLLNLGTPDAATIPAVRRYLKEFLNDPRVVDLAAMPRWLLLHLFILPFRPRRSAAAYQKIWTQQGSPLLIHTTQLKVQLERELGNDFVVEMGMRYGNPSIRSAVKKLRRLQCDRVIVLPLFPQYSSAATGSALEKALNEIRSQWNIPSVSIYNEFFDDEGYIDSMVTLVNESVNKFKPEHFIFSYHGLPQRHIHKSGCIVKECHHNNPCPLISVANRYCYRAQSYATSRLLAKALTLTPDQYTVAFQSRLGRTPWIKPYTDLILPELIDRGVKKVAVVCPSFVSDCLETLEEVGIRLSDHWRSLGGDNLQLIPCLNAHPKWVTVVARMIRARG